MSQNSPGTGNNHLLESRVGWTVGYKGVICQGAQTGTSHLAETVQGRRELSQRLFLPQNKGAGVKGTREVAGLS